MLKHEKSAESLDRRWIASHIPHQGAMCLLDQVEYWDEREIRCLASSHRDADNPLRAGGRLGAACGIEYAAQAMAAHGALQSARSDGGPRAGYLVSVRNVRLEVTRLDDLPGDLLICAQCITAGDITSLYEFTLRANDRTLISGRTLVAFDSDSLTSRERQTT